MYFIQFLTLIGSTKIYGKSKSRKLYENFKNSNFQENPRVFQFERDFTERSAPFLSQVHPLFLVEIINLDTELYSTPII